MERLKEKNTRRTSTAYTFYIFLYMWPYTFYFFPHRWPRAFYIFPHRRTYVFYVFHATRSNDTYVYGVGMISVLTNGVCIFFAYNTFPKNKKQTNEKQDQPPKWCLCFTKIYNNWVTVIAKKTLKNLLRMDLPRPLQRHLLGMGH